jgi:hypothetical protein
MSFLASCALLLPTLSAAGGAPLRSRKKPRACQKMQRLLSALLLVAAPSLVTAGECDCTRWNNCNACESWQIVNAMASAPAESDVQNNGCWALYWRPPQEVVDAGGIASMTAAMEALPEDGRVQQRCVVALGKMADDGKKDASGFSQADKVAEAGGIRRLILAMNKLKTLDDQDLAAEVNWHGCYALSSLAKNGQAKAVVDTGGIAAVIAAMQAFPLEEGVPINGCHMLHKLILEGFREEVTAAGAETVAKMAMSAMPQDSVTYRCKPLYETLANPVPNPGGHGEL